MDGHETIEPRPWDPVVEAVMLEDEGEAKRWLLELLESGSDPSVVDPVRRQCAIEAAWEMDRVELVRVLLEHGTEIDLEETDYSCLFSWGSLACAKLILEHGFRFDRFIKRNSLGEPMNLGFVQVLDDVLAKQDRERLELFTAYGLMDLIDVYGEDVLAWTPLISSIKNERIDDARWLISQGADVNAHCEQLIGSTALDAAINESNSDAIEMLLNAGANPNIPTWMQITAVERAVEEDKVRELGRGVVLRVIEAARAFPKPEFPSRSPVTDWPPRLP